MTRRSKKRRPLTGPDRQRYGVSVSRETYRLVQAAAIARGVSVPALVEEVLSNREAEASVEVRGEWCDLVAERAGI